LGLAGDVANDAADIGLQCPRRLVRSLELLGMRIALLLNERELAKARA
jgi:hypothetical protein